MYVNKPNDIAPAASALAGKLTSNTLLRAPLIF